MGGGSPTTTWRYTVTVERKRVLIVDDEKGVRESLTLLLEQSFEVSSAEDGKKGLQALESFEPDVVLLDMMMPELDGLGVLKELHLQNLTIPVVVLTADSAVESVVEAMKLGASEYLTKPFCVESLTNVIVNTLREHDRGESPSEPSPAVEEVDIIEPPRISASPEIPGDFGPLIGISTAMNSVFETIRQVATKDTTVLITGESGTGKELVARQLHNLSPRARKPFVAINCAAIPENLIESELFGHEKGAFTSAVERRIGHFEAADGGTIFLDEIGELQLQTQVKLLRFLQEREFFRVGRSKPIGVDVRVITATNQNLDKLIQEKSFRQDLYYRINVVNIELPPLRDRFEDVERLLEHFGVKFAGRYGERKLSFTRGAIEALIQYHWPGNVRELENIVESLLALAPNDTIDEEEVKRRLKPRPTGENFNLEVFQGSLNFQEAEKLFEREMIEKALKKTDYVQTKAADLLGISRRILKYKMDKLGITEGMIDGKESGRDEGEELGSVSGSSAE